MTKELREMSYDQLIEYSAQVFKEVRRRAYGEGYRQGKFDAEVVNEQTKETSQAKRDRIVEQAKKDIVDLKREGGHYGLSWQYRRNPYLSDGLGGGGSGTAYNCEYNVNKEKRTVVAILRGYNTGDVLERGIAKCAPGDCFNVHIGKAIALRRALGLKVPSDYLNAPQPTEVRVGDVVKFDGRHITVCPGDRLYRHYEDLCAIDSVVAETSEIIDDSREV